MVPGPLPCFVFPFTQASLGHRPEDIITGSSVQNFFRPFARKPSHPITHGRLKRRVFIWPRVLSLLLIGPGVGT